MVSLRIACNMNSDNDNFINDCIKYVRILLMCSIKRGAEYAAHRNETELQERHVIVALKYYVKHFYTDEDLKKMMEKCECSSSSESESESSSEEEGEKKVIKPCGCSRCLSLDESAAQWTAFCPDDPLQSFLKNHINCLNTH
jgi:hypothetical protein